MEPIRQSEGLWRNVYREKQKRALDCPVEKRIISRTTKAVFGSTQGPDARVSTNRYDGVSLEFATTEGDNRATRITGSDGVEGWLVISVRDASQRLRRVTPSPVSDNPYHAEIWLPDEHTKSWEDAEVHLRQFLSLSRWQDRAEAMPLRGKPQAPERSAPQPRPVHGPGRAAVRPAV